jgi:ABC-type lipoprotein export system ATPase subunit
MTLTRVELEDFTAFSHFRLDLSPGINVFVGENGTGKTHLMKVCYAACDVSTSKTRFADKLVRVFLPSGRAPGRLVRRQPGNLAGTVEVRRENLKLTASFSRRSRRPTSGTPRERRQWLANPVESVFIPAKDILANAPGFLSLYSRREVNFEEVYADILHRAYLPQLRGPIDRNRKRLLIILQKAIEGKVTVSNEEFYLRNRRGNLEFTLLAEGFRKLGLLWLLIQNGVLQNGSVLFWDEPESNVNPRVIGKIIEVLLELQREGVQVFIATHNYVVLKELDLLMSSRDKVWFHTLYREDKTGDIACHTTSDFLDIRPDPIGEAFTDLYDREIERSLGGLIS